MRGTANRHPQALQPISSGRGGAMTSPGSTLLPLPHGLLLPVVGCREVWGGGGEVRRKSDVTFLPIDWLLVGGTMTNQQPQKVWRGPAESPVATGRGENVRVLGGARCREVNARGLGLGAPGDKFPPRLRHLRAVRFSDGLLTHGGHEMGKCSTSSGFTPHSIP